MHQARVTHLITSHLRQHSQNKSVKIFDFKQQNFLQENLTNAGFENIYFAIRNWIKKGHILTWANLEVHTRWEGKTTRSYGFHWPG